MQQLTLCWGFLVIEEGIKTRLGLGGGSAYVPSVMSQRDNLHNCAFQHKLSKKKKGELAEEAKGWTRLSSQTQGSFGFFGKLYWQTEFRMTPFEVRGNASAFYPTAGRVQPAKGRFGKLLINSVSQVCDPPLIQRHFLLSARSQSPFLGARY